MPNRESSQFDSPELQSICGWGIRLQSRRTAFRSWGIWSSGSEMTVTTPFYQYYATHEPSLRDEWPHHVLLEPLRKRHLNDFSVLIRRSGVNAFRSDQTVERKHDQSITRVSRTDQRRGAPGMAAPRRGSVDRQDSASRLPLGCIHGEAGPVVSMHCNLSPIPGDTRTVWTPS